jgi:hypothetical protein
LKKEFISPPGSGNDSRIGEKKKEARFRQVRALEISSGKEKGQPLSQDG